jgi:Family of unknown function (DUF6533)
MAMLGKAYYIMARKLSHYFFMASCVIVFYDHGRFDVYVRAVSYSLPRLLTGLTFSQEIEHVWKRKLTLATLLFLVIRYLTPLELLVFMMGECIKHGSHVVSVSPVRSGFYYPALSAPVCHICRNRGDYHCTDWVLHN